MSCTDNIRALFALRGAVALNQYELDQKASCQRITETEIEDADLLYNILDFLGRRMCVNQSFPEIRLTFGGSYLPPETAGQISLAFTDYQGNTSFSVQLQPSAIDTIPEAILFFLAADQDDSVYSYEELEDENGVLIRFWPGQGGSFIQTEVTAPSANSFITVSGNLVAATENEEGCMVSASGDDDRLKRIADWFAARMASVCNDKVYQTNMGPCPPPDYIPCDLLSSNMLSFVYYEEFVPGGITSPLPAPDLNYVAISPQSPIVSIVASSSSQIRLREDTTDDTYILRYVGDLAGYSDIWEFIGVIPSGDTDPVDASFIVIDPLATYTFDGDLTVITEYGNRCSISIQESFLGSELAATSVSPMTLSGFEMGAENAVGEYSQVCVPTPGAEVLMYRDGNLIYKWIVGTDPLVEFDGIEFTLNYPASILPLIPGTYSIVWPQGWVKSPQGALAPAIALNDYTFVVSASPTGFPYTFAFNLS